jgi:hypothetical protein
MLLYMYYSRIFPDRAAAEFPPEAGPGNGRNRLPKSQERVIWSDILNPTGLPERTVERRSGRRPRLIGHLAPGHARHPRGKKKEQP